MMKYILKVLFAGVVALVVLLAFAGILVRGCAAGLDQATKDPQQDRYKSVSPSRSRAARLKRREREAEQRNEVAQRKALADVNEMFRELEQQAEARERRMMEWAEREGRRATEAYLEATKQAAAEPP